MKSNNNKFDIFIVEDHNDVVEPIHRAIGSKRLNFSNLILVHFDSHPDLGIPQQNFNADDVFNKAKLYEHLSIENWIMPIVYAGHFTDIVWIKPQWSTQIDLGEYKQIIIGKNKFTNTIQCNCRESYFITDLLYANERDLVNCKEFNLHVYDFDQIVSMPTDNNSLFHLLNRYSSRQIVFDIDLDFFSTMNPFIEILGENYNQFLAFYEHTQPNNLLREHKNSEDQFDHFYDLYKKEKLENLTKILSLLTSPSVNSLNELINCNKDSIDILHSYCSSLDDRPLPHHISTQNEIDKMMDNFKLFLNIFFNNNSKNPGLITIARSSIDDYCPVDKVDQLQNDVIQIIQSHFNRDSINSINKEY
jgi:hypothetical protein